MHWRKKNDSFDKHVLIKKHKDKKGGHFHVILEDIDDCHVSVGLTTKPKKGKNSPNYKLQKSPLNDGKTSYMRRQGLVAPKTEYIESRSGSMTQHDYERAQLYGTKAKKKYILDKKK